MEGSLNASQLKPVVAQGSFAMVRTPKLQCYFCYLRGKTAAPLFMDIQQWEGGKLKQLMPVAATSCA